MALQQDSGEFMSRARDADRLLKALGEAGYDARCAALRDACPCRSHVRDPQLWKEIFGRAIGGGMRERDRAAHAIGTLMEKAERSDEWRAVLARHEEDLDLLMRDTRASRVLLGQMKRHGHAHRGAARQGYRRRRKVLELHTPAELAVWVNERAGLEGADAVPPSDPGVARLWNWLRNRVTRQPGRGTREDEMVARARRYLPHLFQNPASA